MVAQTAWRNIYNRKQETEQDRPVTQ